MILNVPEFNRVPGLQQFLKDMIIAVNKDTADKLDRVTANHAVLVYSPDGNVWSVQAANDGTLHTTRVGTASSV
jgi:hypothetical protein